jgi:hypothetical protein
VVDAFELHIDPLPELEAPNSFARHDQ